MAISRTWYDSLVDDSGSNTDGTVIDKADFDALLDAIDAFVETTGTWTPALQFGGAAAGMTYGTRSGTYTKSANYYVLEFRIQLTAKGSSTGSATITGVPAAAAGSPVGSPLDFNVAGAGTMVGPYSLMSASTIYLAHTPTNARVLLTEANFTDTTDVRGSIVYRV